MFDIRLIRNDPEAVARALARRGGDWDLSGLLEIDARRRDLTHQVESRVADVRKRSKKIGELKRNKASDEEVQAFLAENQRLTAEAKSMEGELARTRARTKTISSWNSPTRRMRLLPKAGARRTTPS